MKGKGRKREGFQINFEFVKAARLFVSYILIFNTFAQL